MKKNEKVIISVLVPVYNGEKYVERCLFSIMKQTHPSLQIIVIDDGSTDCSLEKCRRVASTDDRVQIIHTENIGVSHARNTALAEAIGEYVAFVDCDDWIEPDMYESMIDVAIERQADVVIQPFIFQKGNFHKTYIDTKAITEMNGRQAAKEMLDGRLFAGQLCNKLFRRELLPAGFCAEDVYVYEDNNALWDLFLSCERVVYSDKHCYHYVLHNLSAMHAPYNDKCLTGRNVAQRIIRNATIEAEDVLPYAYLFALRVEYNILYRAYCARRERPEVFQQVYAAFQQTARLYLTKETRQIMRDNREKLRFFLVAINKEACLIYQLLLKIARMAKKVLVSIRDTLR